MNPRVTLTDPDDDDALLDAEVSYGTTCVITIEQTDIEADEPGAIVRTRFLPTKAQAAMLAVLLAQFAKS